MGDFNVMSHRERADLDRHITGNFGEDSVGPTVVDPCPECGLRAPEVYEAFVAQMFIKRSTGEDGLLHASVGIAGEAGEILDAVKKTWVYGKPLDRENLIEELGDIEFYAQALRSLIGVSREDVIAANMAKLRKRYPQGYTDQHAIARLDKA